MNNFARRYGEDFNHLDANAICSWYEFPLSILTPQGNSIFRTEKELLASVDELLKIYRSFNFSHAVVLKESVTMGGYGLDQSDVIWRLIDENNEAIIDFEITYFFKEKSGKTRLCSVVSHNEFSEWQKKHEAL